MEQENYTVGSVVLSAAGVGAPHIRQRLYWVADSAVRGREYVQHAKPAKLLNGSIISGEQVQQPCSDSASIGGLADADGCKTRDGIRLHGLKHDAEHGGHAGAERPGPTNGFWRDADWLFCRDGKWRPIEPGLATLVARTSDSVGRVRADQGHRAGRLKGYGNAINAVAAKTFIEAYLETR